MPRHPHTARRAVTDDALAYFTPAPYVPAPAATRPLNVLDQMFGYFGAV